MEDNEDKILVNQVEALDEQVKRIQTLLDPVINNPLEDSLAGLTLEQQVKLSATIALAINTLSYVCLKTIGISPEEHQSKMQMDRIESYFSKINALKPRFVKLQQMVDANQIPENSNLNTINMDSSLRLMTEVQKSLDKIKSLNK